MLLKSIFLNTYILFNLHVLSYSALIITQNAATLDCMPSSYITNCSIEVKYPGTVNSLISGQGTVTKPIPPNMRVRVILQRQLEKKNITFGNTIEHNACDYIKNDRLLYPGILKYGNFPRNCPIPLQTYFINDYQVPIKDLPPILPQGKFIVTMLLLVKNNPISTMKWFGEIQDSS